MKFHNTPNEEVKLPDGRIIYLSRSAAIVAIILAKEHDNDDIYVLTEKRSAIMDEPNKWAAVSGYIDWNESGYEAIIREIYEETSFYLPDHKSALVFDNDGQPFYVHTDPKTDAKQNISLTYIFIYEFIKLPRKIENFKDKEISQIKWMKLSEVFTGDKKWAFDHDKRIEMAYTKFY